MQMTRRWYTALCAVCAVVACGIAAGIALTFSGSPAAAAPTKKQYLARVAAICRVYGPKLDKVPAADIAEPGNIIASVTQALPLVRAETSAVRRLAAPKELRTNLERWFRLHDQGIKYLEAALQAGRRVDLRSLIVAYGKFILQGPKATRIGSAIGIPSPPC